MKCEHVKAGLPNLPMEQYLTYSRSAEFLVHLSSGPKGAKDEMLSESTPA
jgi:hypothetical protein